MSEQPLVCPTCGTSGFEEEGTTVTTQHFTIDTEDTDEARDVDHIQWGNIDYGDPEADTNAAWRCDNTFCGWQPHVDDITTFIEQLVPFDDFVPPEKKTANDHFAELVAKLVARAQWDREEIARPDCTCPICLALATIGLGAAPGEKT